MWIPVTKGISQALIEHLSAHLQHQMCTFLRPLHLLLFGKPLTYDLVYPRPIRPLRTRASAPLQWAGWGVPMIGVSEPETTLRAASGIPAPGYSGCRRVHTRRRVRNDHPLAQSREHKICVPGDHYNNGVLLYFQSESDKPLAMCHSPYCMGGPQWRRPTIVGNGSRKNKGRGAQLWLRSRF